MVESDDGWLPRDLVIVIVIIIISMIVIMITRPKPAYSRQGLAGLWGQNTDQVVDSFWGVLNHEKPTRNLEKL